jgi:signal transduction histidine kinase/regulation of enolase protein 1 (concanavalin A-like superfamily)
MSYLLSKPRTVLAVGDAERRDSIASAVEAGIAESTVTVATVDAARETLDAREDVGCVVVAGTDTERLTAVCTAAADAEPSGLLPVVAWGPEAVASTAARHEACRYLPESAGADDLRAVVDDALSTYERRRAEAADSSILQTLFDEGNLTMFAKDDRARYVRMADIPYTPDPDEARGGTDLEVFGDRYPEISEETYEDDLKVVETGEPLRENLEQYEGRGGDHWSESTKLPWRVDGELIGLVGYAVDATERVRFENELSEQRRRFDQFASYVSHDLRTPLQVSVGALEQARESEGEDLQSALDRIERANQRIEEILADLSALSKSDEQGENLPEEVLDALDVGVSSTELAPLVENVWQVDGTEEATLDVVVPEGTEIRAEAETVRPLVENLLKNAVDHGGSDVTVRVGATGRGFYVADDGPGIPDSERERVLEPGYTTSEEGTGTGLAIVRETVEKQRWDVEIGESDQGGARFDIRDAPVVVPTAVTPGNPVELVENRDVGDVSIPGEATYDEFRDVWTVVGNGRDIWQDIDEFHFVHGGTSAPVRIEGRLDDLDGVHEYSKAGLMVRDGLDDDAAFAFVGATSEYGSETLWRERTGAEAASEQFEEPYDAFQWYRVDAIGGEVTLSFSTDGEEWQALDQRPVELGDSVCVGLAVCSHTTDETIEARFENVTVRELDVE